MEDNKLLISLILHGCKLARELESNLANHPDHHALDDSCQQIIRIFSDARQQIRHVSENASRMSLFQTQTPPPAQQLYIRSGGMDTAGGQSDGGVPAMGGDESIVDVTLAGASSQRQRKSVLNCSGKRKEEEGDRRKVQVAAPQFGNTDVPPDDGFAWKKYGQKEILGSLFPRSYYRCTHQKLYNCPAKKQVQRLDTNPFTYEVTYRGFHSCHLSATAPTAVPPWISMVDLQSTSHQQYDDPLVADMADAMFNSTSTTTNTMEIIFSSSIDDWEENKKGVTGY